MKIAPEYLYPAPFYNFLFYMAECDLEGPILDCGAGGPIPKQALFVKLGFETMGIEISKERMQMAQGYATEHGLILPMQIGDMRAIPFSSNHFTFVYSWNSIFHMNRRDIKKSIQEMIRVLKPGGLCFVNFITTESARYGVGEEREPGECTQFEGDEVIMHTFFRDDEADDLFGGLEIEILYREKRTFGKKYEDELVKDSYIDFIIQKKVG